jgi:hypothetical protein
VKKIKPLDYKVVLAEFPPGYNAHNDSLEFDGWGHRESVNRLLAALLQAASIIELMKQPKIRLKNQNRRDPT